MSLAKATHQKIFLIGLFGSLLFIILACDAPPPRENSAAGTQLSKTIYYLSLDDLKRANKHLNEARHLDPKHPALAPIAKRIDLERSAQRLRDRVSRLRKSGRVEEALEVFREIPQGTSAHSYAQTIHADLPVLLAFSKVLNKRTRSGIAELVLTQLHSRAANYGHRVQLSGPRENPSLSIPSQRFVFGSCQKTIDCKTSSYLKVKPDSMAINGQGDLQQSEIRIRSRFFIDVLEVSVKDFQTCLKDGACHSAEVSSNEKNPQCNLNASLKNRHPINCVSAKGAAEYCEWSQGRLPTEVEWELAARGDDARRFPWGDDVLHRCNRPRAQITDDGDCAQPTGTTHTGSFPEGISPMGVLDAAGNVAEWTASPFTPSDDLQAFPEQPRVTRGGDFSSPPHAARVTSRTSTLPRTQSPKIGFRCAYDL